MASAVTDYGSLVAVVAPIVVSILGGGLAMAWRLGRLEQTVRDLVDRVDDLEQDRRFYGRRRL